MNLPKTTGLSGTVKMPPPAKPIPGIRGNPPLPVGKIVGARTKTPGESAVLDALGWTADMGAIPANMAQILAEEERVMTATNQARGLPVDPRKPRLEVLTQNLKDLPAAEQQRIREKLQQSAAQQQQQQEFAAEQQNRAALEQRVPGISAALAAADEALIDDRAPQPAAPSAGPPNSPAPQTSVSGETGAISPQTHCPHCDWPLDLVDIPEPPYEDKLSFLHAILGEKCWVKRYSLFGGQVTAVFRTLTVREIEAIFKQTYLDQPKLPTPEDVHEQIARYRLYLQLQTVTSAVTPGFVHELPDGLTADTNPTAVKQWDSVTGACLPENTPLPQIETWLLKNVLKTESLFRVLNKYCQEFSRLTAKMEALVDNPDFWQPTAVPS